MRQEGTVTRWNDQRGFGFITPAAGGPDVFVHISAVPRDIRPTVGSKVTYRPTSDDQGRPRTSDIRGYRASTPPGVGVAAITATVFIGAAIALAVSGMIPTLVPAVLLVTSVVAFLMYRTDKRAAVRGAYRIPESTLHLVSLLGGWPGALVARHVLRHKTRTQPFRTLFWVTVILNCAALAWITQLVTG